MTAAPAPAEKDAGGHRYPDFLCIGTQKAGTTWLDRNLRRHPGIWLPPIKELQYFNDVHIPASRSWTERYRREKGAASLARYLKQVPEEERDAREIACMTAIVTGPISDDWYGRIFALAAPGQACGEISPDYCILPEEGIAHIVRLAPDIRIVLSLRDPIARSWSHMRMISNGRDPDQRRPPEVLARNREVLARSDYPTILARWRRYIPEDRLLVFFMDDIVAEPQAVLERVCAFLGVPYREKLFRRADNPVHVGEAQAIPEPVLAVLKNGLRPTYEGLMSLYPEIGARWAAKYY